MTTDLDSSFDLIYSSLTFFHIADKQQAISRCADLLRAGGRLVISIEKEQRTAMNFGDGDLVLYPDQPETMSAMISHAGLVIELIAEAAFAYIITAKKPKNSVSFEPTAFC